MGEEEQRVRDDSVVPDLGNDRRWYHQHDREQSISKGDWEEIEKMMSSIFYMLSLRSLLDILEMCSWQLNE